MNNDFNISNNVTLNELTEIRKNMHKKIEKSDNYPFEENMKKIRR